MGGVREGEREREVSVFLGRVAITRPPALTIPSTIGKARSIERMAEAEEEEDEGEEGGEFSRRELIIESTKFAEFVSTLGILCE